MKKKILIFGGIASAILLTGAGIIGYQDWQLRGSTPGSPASGYLRMWADTSAGKFLCKTSAGAACYFDSATSGSVTSFTVAGTANQITATGTCTVTSTGTCTLSVPSDFRLPGTINKLTLTQPATGSTITVVDGKTATFNNSITFAGTDSTTMTFPSASATITQTIASGTSALGTSAISSGACATVVTTSATGTLSTDAIIFTPNASIKALTGYTPATTGGLTIAAYPTADNVNYDVCNWSTGSLTPSALTLNWRVVR